MTCGTKGLAYIVDEDKKLFNEDILVLDLAKNFIDDIKNNIDDWSNWDYMLNRMDKKTKVVIGN